MSSWWESCDNPFLWTEPLHGANARAEVAVCGEHQGGVIPILYCVLDQRNGDIDIGLFLLIADPGSFAAPAPAAFLLEAAIDNSHEWTVLV